MRAMGVPKSRSVWFTLNALAWIVTNALGAAAFLHFASQTWIQPELRGEDVARDGDAVVWFATALPFALACLLADLVMLALAVRIGVIQKRWSPLMVAGATGVVWAVAMAVDVTHRF